MTRMQRRIFTRGAIVGLLLTITVIAADFAGALAVPEDWLYDLRARYFQFFTPKPSDLLVHVDIDDRSMEDLGAWPWPRARLAAMLDEMKLAGVKAVGLDILFSEPQLPQPDFHAMEDGSKVVAGIIDNDAEFAAAVKRLGNVVVPSSLSLENPEPSASFKSIEAALEDDPELDELALVKRLGSNLERAIIADFLVARREAVYHRIDREMKPGMSREELRKAVIKTQAAGVSSPVTRAFDEQYARWESIEAVKRLAALADPGSAQAIHTLPKVVPLPAIAEAAAATAFVDFTTARDGALRTVPLLAEMDGRLIPHLGLSLALQSLGVRAADLKVEPSSITIPVSDGRQIVIPVSLDFVREQGRTATLMFNLPWFGGREWESMYDWPQHRQTLQHLSIGYVWGICETTQKIQKNNEIALDGLRYMAEHFSARAPTSNPSDMANPRLYAADISAAITANADFEQAYAALKPEEIDDDGRRFLQWVKALRTIREQNQLLGSELDEQRKTLAQLLAGKSVLIGYTATGMLDVTRTSLHARCPGVVAHGLVFSSIMSGDFWRRGPVWATLLATLVVGTIVTATASWLSPMLGLAITFLVGAGYAFFNGLLLFDRNNLIVGLAGPLSVAVLVWAGCTMNRIIIEASERARITRRFRSYVDPTLVTHVLENPDLVRLEGETRELTVVFTDLAGFTTISERLGEATVPLLNDYMGRMVPIIRAQKGYVNKFLGDGIMFFFGAPIPGSTHASQAVATVLEMQVAVKGFNDDLAARNLPAIAMRAGISSGKMVVGDAGSAEASDYTVLGDTVNLGARLESANKAVGTKILMNARTAELLDGRFLIRPVGKLQVVGKEEGVMTFEAMSLLSQATDDQKELASRTREMVDAFIGSRFEQCMQIADAMDAALGVSYLTAMYREECQAYLKDPPPEGFDGRIRLSEK